MQSIEYARIISSVLAVSYYDTLLDLLEGLVLTYLDEHPELKTTPNTEDMWDYRDKHEDVDTYDEDEEGW